MTSGPKTSSRILCVSWDAALAESRELLFTHSGFNVISAMGEEEAMFRCRTKADLLVLGHSVPQEEKLKVVHCFRRFNDSPVLSLLRPGQAKLPEVDYGVEYLDPEGLLRAVRSIMRCDS